MVGKRADQRVEKSVETMVQRLVVSMAELLVDLKAV